MKPFLSKFCALLHMPLLKFIFWHLLFQYTRHKSKQGLYTHVFGVCGPDKPISKVITS